MGRIIVGFGINPEISFSFDESDMSQKVPAKIAMDIAGTSVNVAFNLCQWGHKVKLLAAIGEECPYRDFLARTLEKRGVAHHLFEAKERTSMAAVSLPHNGSRQERSKIFSDKPPYIKLPLTEIGDIVYGEIPDVVLATGVTPEESRMVHAMFDAAPEHALKVLNPRHSLITDTPLFEALLEKTTILAVNEDEFLSYVANHHVTFEEMARMHQLGPTIVLVTRDSRGAMLSIRNGCQIDQPVIKIGSMLDEVGAGDCFLAYFVHALLKHVEMTYAMKFSATAAGIKVTKIGGSNVPTKEEVENSLHLIDLCQAAL
ncbi:MAG TPA: carbohydrate kinase family protein [Patescibacteria group bacterium]|nr:carbohydrate kinase family protein [Patescibacteria group bacterium]